MENTLSNSDIDTLRRLALAAECRDSHTGAHMVRTGALSAFLGAQIGLPNRVVEKLRHAAPMHDLGKIGIPDSILRKPTALTPKEFEVMKTHTTIGAKILENSQNVILCTAREIALSHHERWDGRGYPIGLSGEDIPLPGRIVGLIDAFDAMTSTRSYRTAKSFEETCAIIEEEKGRQFDPRLVEAFLDNIQDILDLRSRMGPADCLPDAIDAQNGFERISELSTKKATRRDGTFDRPRRIW